ncbi:MAG TPA: lipoyl(octanoyl) transferase LipB [Enteractinococcus sp.]
MDVVHVIDLLDTGLKTYAAMDELQRELHAKIATGQHPNTCLLFEAESTYTAGRHTQQHDIIDESLDIVETDRAGSVTWHGPGQLVCYPLVKLAAPVDVIKYIRAVEGAVLDTLQQTFDLDVDRIEGRAGVWIGNRKISAIGLKISQDTSLHGISLNVTTDPEQAFVGVIPCGITDATVTSMAEEGVATTLSAVAEPLTAALAHRLEPLLAPTSIEGDVHVYHPAG